MEKAGYYLLKATTWILHLFPRRILYIVSDFLFVIVYSVFRYRRAVVIKNLRNSFPEKKQEEISVIARKFFHHLCDSAIETLYFDRMTVTEAKNCAKFINPELPNSYLEQGRTVICFLGHYNNWEWLCNWPLYSPHRFYPVYKKLKNNAFERFYVRLRGRFGAIPLERALTFRQLYSDHQEGVPTFSAFLFDQTPRIYEIHHWVTFLNQDTPVVLGAEKLAQKLDAVVLFMNSRKLKRGVYESEYQLVTASAAQCPRYEITEQCTRLLEQQIRLHPEYWLWSHKRWKHTREKVAKFNTSN